MSGSRLPRLVLLEAIVLDPPNKYLLDYDGDPGNITTLNHTLWTRDLKPNVTVGYVMDLCGDLICAEYVDNEGYVDCGSSI